MIRIVSREDWLAERRAFLAREKDFTRARDALSAARRALPAVKVEKPYRFESEEGPIALEGLFGGRRQLIIYHFMFGSDWAEGCPSCSFWADNFEGIGIHLAHRDTALVAVSKATLEKLLAYRARMGWSFPWVSAGDSGFNEDFAVSFAGAGGEYNYAPRGGGHAEMPGISVFLREGDNVLHTYSAYARGLDMLNGAYHYLDLTPLGRHEDGLPWPMAWVKRHDRYEAEKGDAT
jgi:predicted dithiol-disulfide oxidoreductase (DUF899 family)